MAHNFRSVTLLTKLAHDAVETPPPTDDPYVYFDHSLVILSRNVENNNAFRGQTNELIKTISNTVDIISNAVKFIPQDIDDRLEQIEKRIDKRFEEVDKRFEQVDKRFEQVDKRFEEVDKRFEEVNNRFNQVDGVINNILVELENSKALNANRRIVRAHQPINLIKVLKPTADGRSFEWKSHPAVPKHLKALYFLGRHADRKFEEGFSGDMRQEMIGALSTITQLSRFYDVLIYSDNTSDSEATEVDIQGDVNGYMEELLGKWGLNWTKVCEIVERVLKLQPPQQAGAKRSSVPKETQAQIPAHRQRT
ncbi:hypothetical protein FQN57_007374 [Myotisia sp. PD_48]|nr:hypothetical protein FQN57_007374 [Myotisia sp. PD_48]